jgi:hypothetical protein
MAGDTDLIAAIYDAIIDPSGWDEVVKRIVTATKSIAGGIALHAEGSGLAALCNVDPSYADAYVENYSTIDPLMPETRTVAPGEVRAGTYITQTDSYRASAYYNEYMHPQGWADIVAIGLLRASNAVGLLCVHRSPLPTNYDTYLNRSLTARTRGKLHRQHTEALCAFS